MKLYLIRHGRTPANESWQYCGFLDVPLSEGGAAELRERRAAGGYPALSGLKIYTSGMLRTEQTLSALFGEVPHETLPEFKEMNFGIFEGRSYEEMKEDPAYIQWCEGDNLANVCPGGESGNQMAERVYRALDRLLEQGSDCLIVSHGGPISAVFMRYFPKDAEYWYKIQPKNGEGYLFEFEEKNAISYTKIPEV